MITAIGERQIDHYPADSFHRDTQMTYQIQVHISGDDPVVLDVDELPSPNDQWIIGTNPRRRDQKEVSYVLHEVNQVMFPINRINFIQILPAEGEKEVPTFVRE